MKNIFRIAVITLFCSGVPLLANTHAAATCSLLDVQAAVNLANTGDTATIPAGTCTWDTTLTLAKGITLQGAGVGQTIIRDNVQAPSQGLLSWTCEQNGIHRLTGIEFQDGGRASITANGVVRINCTNLGTTSIRVDNNKFDNLNGVNVRPDRAVGVVENNVFINSPNRFAIQVFDVSWGGVGSLGDGSWSAPLLWGSDQFLFVEDNVMTVTGPNSYACTDGSRGQRVVFRFNTLTNCSFGVHGTEASGRNRGGVGIEIYKNTHEGLYSEAILVNVRSGSALIWGNAARNLGPGMPLAARLTQDRTVAVFNTWLGSDGTNPWDVNDGANPYQTRTATNAAALSVTSAGAGWTPDQWVGFTVRKTSGCVPSGPATSRVNCHSIILGNSIDTISFASAGFGADMSFAPGDTFELNKVLEVMDGVGRRGGSLLYGQVPGVPSGWNDQVTAPIYEWLNTNNGADIDTEIQQTCTGTCRENEHYYNYSPGGFDGSSGVGSGLFGTMPSTCTVGVWYWATDRGEWWSSNAGFDGQAYRCTAPNTWSVAYTPFTYPHPLAGPLAPATITAQPTDQTVVEGNSATFTVVATGNPSPTYQWRKGGVDIPGATNSSYTTPVTVAAMDDQSTFDVVVNHSSGSLTSTTATLNVTSAAVGAPSITTQPVNRTVVEGQTATFAVTATGTPSLTYQWRKSGVDISGARASSYTTPPTTAADDASIFDVVVSNGGGTVVSYDVSLTVNPTVGTAPAITMQPVNQTVVEGQTATFTVTATGTPSLTYQWRKSGVDINGARASSYTTPPTTAADDASIFDVVVSNGGGTVVSYDVSLTVNPTVGTAPSITTQPVNRTVVEGQTATFTVTATGLRA